MLLYLVNPANVLVSMNLNRKSFFSRFRLWEPLGLLVLAGLTPADWQVTVLDENVGPVDYDSLPRPDLVGITAFTSQAPRAYQIAAELRARGIPVVMGGIHATMRVAEASVYVDSVVTGEAESVWAEVVEDVRAGRLQARYDGGQAGMGQTAPARHDLLPHSYAFGSVQTTRGCSLNCTFCSVTEFNGARYRQRPVADVVEEFKTIPERRVLIVDDNLIGRKPEHVERAKELFRALAAAGTGKAWIGQTTVNFADDEELLDLAKKSGCMGVFIGFESATPEGLPELGRKSAMLSGRNIAASVERIHRHGMMVVGSFIMGLDSDRPGVGRLIADAAVRYGIDNMNVLFLTPLPGTHGRLPRGLEVLHAHISGSPLQIRRPGQDHQRDEGVQRHLLLGREHRRPLSPRCGRRAQSAAGLAEQLHVSSQLPVVRPDVRHPVAADPGRRGRERRPAPSPGSGWCGCRVVAPGGRRAQDAGGLAVQAVVEAGPRAPEAGGRSPSVLLGHPQDAVVSVAAGACQPAP